MEAIGIVVLVVGVMLGVAYLVKNQYSITLWLQTSHYDKAYKVKALKRSIEDAEDELERLEAKQEK